MKKLFYSTLAVLLIFSCESNEDPEPVAELSSQTQISNGLRPLQDLFVSNISNGLAYAIDNQGQTLALHNGNPVCHSDFPTSAFKKISFKEDAPSGIYRSASKVDVGFFDGDLSSIRRLHRNCVTRGVTVPRTDCPPNYIGAVTYTIEECYIGFVGSPFVTKRDTIGVSSTPCIPAFVDIPDLYWELPDGTQIDPNCLTELGLFPTPGI